jgi:uroporphyrin-3 C-methyltransferase
MTLAVLGVLGWQWYDLRDRVDTLSATLAAERNASQEGRTLVRQTQDSLQALQGKVGALEAQVDAAQGQQLALESLYQELSRTRDERVLAEVEQSLAIAAQQLQLAGNVEAALIALQGAEARLGRTAQPQLLPLRKLIARDIDRLKAMPGANITGLSLKIESVVAVVDSLPLAYEQRPQGRTASGRQRIAKPASTEYWRELGADLWREAAAAGAHRTHRPGRSGAAVAQPELSSCVRTSSCASSMRAWRCCNATARFSAKRSASRANSSIATSMPGPSRCRRRSRPWPRWRPPTSASTCRVWRKR